MHGYPDEEYLFVYGDTGKCWGYAVARHFGRGTGDGELKMVDLDTGFTDWPIFYEPWKAAWDYPEHWPHYLKEAAIILDLRDRGIDEELHYARIQLCLMAAFMEDTPETKDPDLRAFRGDLPYYLAMYEPQDWNMSETPIHIMWADYVTLLKRNGLKEYADMAEELEIGDLLAISEEYDEEGLKGYPWKH